MGIFGMNTDTVSTRSTNFTTASEAFTTSIQTLNTFMHGELGEIWKGQSGQSFVAQWDALMPSLKEASRIVETIGTQMKQSAEATATFDNEMSKGHYSG